MKPKQYTSWSTWEPGCQPSVRSTPLNGRFPTHNPPSDWGGTPAPHRDRIQTPASQSRSSSPGPTETPACSHISASHTACVNNEKERVINAL